MGKWQGPLAELGFKSQKPMSPSVWRSGCDRQAFFQLSDFSLKKMWNFVNRGQTTPVTDEPSGLSGGKLPSRT